MGLCDTVDPLAGSYYVETLTNQMEESIRAAMDEVDAQGGIVRAVAEGQIQSAISRQAFERLRKLERGEIRKVGVNCYRVEEDEPQVEFHPFNEAACAEQIKRLNRARSERDDAKVGSVLQTVLAEAQAGRNVMPGMVAAVKAYATVGELTHCLVEAYGRYDEPVRL
jgi:methylmalonyl-CoA mutase N-terminal domain/subunit